MKLFFEGINVAGSGFGRMMVTNDLIRRPQFWGVRLLLITFFCAFAFSTSQGQALAPILRGDHGLKSGSIPPPGWYVTNITMIYDTHKIKDQNGDTRNGLSLFQVVNGTAVTYVSKKKVLGGNYSASVVAPIANVAIETPFASSTTGIGYSDTYFQPLQLGWATKRADFQAGYGVYAPTGRFTSGASNNTGLGMWSHELSAGTTVYLDKKKEWHAATTGYFNMQSKIKGTNRKVGNLLSFEGGFGRSFNHYLSNIGAVYFAQLKVSNDRNVILPPGFFNKDRYYGVGGEINTVIPLSKKTMTSFGGRFLAETNNRTATQGNLFYMWFTIIRP